MASIITPIPNNGIVEMDTFESNKPTWNDPYRSEWHEGMKLLSDGLSVWRGFVENPEGYSVIPRASYGANLHMDVIVIPETPMMSQVNGMAVMTSVKARMVYVPSRTGRVHIKCLTVHCHDPDTSELLPHSIEVLFNAVVGNQRILARGASRLGGGHSFSRNPKAATHVDVRVVTGTTVAPMQFVNIINDSIALEQL
ncbi:MAG: hypothetical protein CMF22_11845 [Idiomarinaceae bacterium]|nr:hypothetical protein [Idiomarinaceae bacterium]|tara:strand:+ start:35550 stop:36140 length:591 start_codon:yes stop_codon:yes gene_type:complete